MPPARGSALGRSEPPHHRHRSSGTGISNSSAAEANRKDSMKFDIKDVLSGAMFIALGLYFAVDSWLQLKLGSALMMGPGYFPLIVGTALALVGLVVLVRSFRLAANPISRVSWRGFLLVTASIVFFAITLRGLGLALGLGISVMLASLATEKNSVLQSFLIAAVFTAIAIGVFIYALGIPFAVVGPWIWKS